MSIYDNFCRLMEELGSDVLCRELYVYFSDNDMINAIDDIANTWDIILDDDND